MIELEGLSECKNSATICVRCNKCGRFGMHKVDLHKKICGELAEIYEKKNHDYGDSFSKSYEEYGLTMVCIRLQDKVNRLKVLAEIEGKVEDETLEDTLMDLANYSILTLIELDKREEEKC